jgi:hypothetical protein
MERAKKKVMSTYRNDADSKLSVALLQSTSSLIPAAYSRSRTDLPPQEFRHVRSMFGKSVNH